ncbi:hypothetical protein E3P99_02422 [Wallemia hederae]|uniref:Mediator of RNA polymerase II transcription subunit 4 n=1 Tax=Wallemia hederae TaxID=1540922 RepID=A0A4T0FK58_9BASI|nr:hypothetical protein E3P99_02422 [Wallemia hederae]
MVETVRESLAGTLKEIDKLSQEMFAQLSSQPVKPAKVDLKQLSRLNLLDSKLARELEEMRMHQQRQSVINTLEEDIMALENTIQDSLHTLQAASNDVDKMATEAESAEKRTKEAREADIPTQFLLEYAQKLAAFTHAPPSVTKDTQQPPQLAQLKVPFPTESNMRRGALFQAQAEEELSLQVGESREITSQEKEANYNGTSTNYTQLNTQNDMQALDGDGDVTFDLLD